VAVSVAKLKSYWDLLEDAPEDIQRLIEEVEILSLILDDIKDDQVQNPISSLLLDGTSLSRSLQHCKMAADRLRLLTDDMGSSIDTSHHLKKRWASAKVLLKKDKIKKFKVELESATRLLSLSHQNYTRYLTNVFKGLSPSIILSLRIFFKSRRPGILTSENPFQVTSTASTRYHLGTSLTSYSTHGDFSIYQARESQTEFVAACYFISGHDSEALLLQM
jgi:hypothetical protein